MTKGSPNPERGDEMNAVQLLTFALGDWTFGMPLSSVQEVQRSTELEALFVAGQGAVGMFRLRGETLPGWGPRAVLEPPPAAPARRPVPVLAAGGPGGGR